MDRSTPISNREGAANARLRLPEEWREWVSDSLAAGADEATLATALTENGFATGLARQEIRRARGRQGRPVAERPREELLKKLLSLAAAKSRLAELDPSAAAVERRRRLDREDFLHSFYAANRPVVLTGALDASAAYQRWTPAYLDEVCGDSTVEVMTRRDANTAYEIESDRHRTRMKFSEYISLVTATGQGNDIYLVANNDFFGMPNADTLLNEVPRLDQYLDWRAPARQVFFWFGPAGTVTPLHHDLMNVMLAQIRGRKRLTLISPEQTPWVYNTVGVYSAVDCERPDLNRHPLFGKVRKIQLDLYPGEVLFIPVGWWHHVRALDLSMTVTYTNFQFPNAFEWNEPAMP
jgi:ribosomal protein L16 Arg81 hydroxylase